MRNLLCGALALGLFPYAVAAPAAAQIVSDPNAIRSCLCEHQFVSAEQESVAADRRGLEAARRRQAALAGEIAEQRAQIDVHNGADIDAFKRLLARRDAAVAATTAAAEAYDAAAKRYNRSIAAYKTGCAGRSYDGNVLRRVRATLICPRPSAR